MLLQGDTGQHYTKISINMVNREELEWEERVRLPAAGFEFEDLGDISGVNSPHQKKRRRRSREEGIGGGASVQGLGALQNAHIGCGEKG